MGYEEQEDLENEGFSASLSTTSFSLNAFYAVFNPSPVFWL